MRQRQPVLAPLSMFPVQVQSVPGAEMVRKIRTSCGLFR